MLGKKLVSTPATKDRVGAPVLHLARQEVTALEEQDWLPEPARECASVPPPAPVPMMMTS